MKGSNVVMLRTRETKEITFVSKDMNSSSLFLLRFSPQLTRNRLRFRQAHGISCLQAFAHWLELFNLEAKRQTNSSDSTEKLKSVIVSILEGILPLLQSTVSDFVSYMVTQDDCLMFSLLL